MSGGFDEPAPLELQGVIGYNGQLPGSLILHPGDEHIIYALGSTLVVKHLTDNTQTFLQKDGHDSKVSCMALSSTGKYLATGQETHMGFPAKIIIWNLETYEIEHKLVLHKGKVQDVAFSTNEHFLVTLGGRDDNKIVVWDVETGQPICGDQAAGDTVLTVRFLNNSNDTIVSGGNYNLKVWEFDLANRKIRPTGCQLGQLRRIIRCIAVDDYDEFMYCGTDTGDVLKVDIKSKLFKEAAPKQTTKKRVRAFQKGVSQITIAANGELIVGAGDGTIAIINAATFLVVRKTKVAGAVSALALNANHDHFFVGTKNCNIYLVNLQSLEYELRNTCHFNGVNDIAFPRGYSELFATCSTNDIRVWHARTRNELLRIQVPNLVCLCVCFSPCGKALLSGWSDGKIRAFKPQTGKLKYAINDAHKDGVTAICCTNQPGIIISGGEAGMVRVWDVSGPTQQMISSLKEHKGRINSICVSNDDTECVSASADGSCIAWSLERFVRNTCLFASTQFQAVVYHPEGAQLLTTGSDRKLTFWNVVDGNPIRITDGSQSKQVNCLDISQDGEAFISAGADKIVKVWGYNEAFQYSQGIGHSGSITKCRISPDQRTIVSVGDEGAIFLWVMPELTVGDIGADEPNDEPVQPGSHREQ
jgi:WD40 repeat protein